MPQKIRFIVLAGLLLALAAGVTAARPGDGDGQHSPCTRHSQCPGASTHYPANECAMPCMEACQEKPKEKCCCSPDKPCDNCPCKEKTEAVGNDADRCGPEEFGVWGGPGNSNIDFSAAPAFGPAPPMNGPFSMAGLPYPIPGQHTPIPFSVCPPPLMPQMGMPQMGMPQMAMPQMMPAPQMVQMPQMPQMTQMAQQFVSEPEREGKQYLVEMKLTEQRKGEKEHVVATPKLAVCEGKPAQMSTGTTHASLWTAGVPSNDFGHEGYQIDVVVNSDRKGHVSLECWLWTSSPDAASGTSALHESRCHTTQTVELGKAAKLSCGQHSLAVTVKEQGTEAVSGSTEPCEKPCTEEKPFEGCKMVEQARFEAPAPKELKTPAAMTFTAIESQPCCEGKMRDLNPPAHLLEVRCGGTSIICDKFDLEMPGHAPLKVCCDGSRVKIAGGTLNALADSVCTGADEGVLQFEGHIRMGDVNIDSGKVSIKLEMCDFIHK